MKRAFSSWDATAGRGRTAHRSVDGVATAASAAHDGFAEEASNIARRLWSKVCRAVAAYRERRSAAVMFAELSKLSDAELSRRGIARSDLHRLVSGTPEG